MDDYLKEEIQEIFDTHGEGYVMSLEGFVNNIEKAKVILGAMTSSGQLCEIKPGFYIQMIDGAFGRYPPAAIRVMQSYARRVICSIAQNPALSANQFGLTTQNPIEEIFLTTGRSEILKIGNQEVRLTRIEEHWLMSNPMEPCGDAVRALVYMGKKDALKNGPLIRTQLDDSQKVKLDRWLDKMPDWVAAALRP